MIRPAVAEDRPDLHAMQAGFDAEGAMLAATRQHVGVPPVIKVVNPWRFDAVMEEPAHGERRDLGCMACIASAALTVFAALWIMLPA